MFCKNCGKEIDDKAAVCPHCGVAQNEQQPIDDSGSIGWGVLGCCIPVVGLILFLVWHDTKPKNASICRHCNTVVYTCRSGWNWCRPWLCIVLMIFSNLIKQHKPCISCRAWFFYRKERAG